MEDSDQEQSTHEEIAPERNAKEVSVDDETNLGVGLPQSQRGEADLREVDTSTNVKPNKGDLIEYFFENGQKNVATITSRAGKSSGICKNSFNVINEAGETSYVDLDRQVRWKVLSSSENRSLIALRDRISSGKITEIQNWKNIEVFEEVEEKGQS